MQKSEWVKQFGLPKKRSGIGIIRTCEHCSNVYEPYSNRQRLCSVCAKTNRYIRKVKPKIIEKKIKDHKWFFKKDGKFFYMVISELEGSINFRWN